jgi:queuine tRNA-ribosyltransferase
MPVGTQASVKGVAPRDLVEIGTSVVLANTYHLYLRPGTGVIERAGGLHRFMNWRGPILTDSGGYQVFSLAGLRGISDEGVEFTSHIDGSRHLFTPERVVEIQRSLGSDFTMVLDECAPYSAPHSELRRAVERTTAWAARCKRRFLETNPLFDHEQALFPVVQGGVDHELRRRSVCELVELEFEGYAIGGLSVGEPEGLMYEATEVCTGLLPANQPRYLMGVGTPRNLLECIARGVDMFDCVLPTRNARNGVLFARDGRLNIFNARFSDDHAPVDGECACPTCAGFSRAYLRHLFKARELLGYQLATIHNLAFYQWLMKEARLAIREDRFGSWKAAVDLRLTAEEVSRETY